MRAVDKLQGLVQNFTQSFQMSMLLRSWGNTFNLLFFGEVLGYFFHHVIFSPPTSQSLPPCLTTLCLRQESEHWRDRQGTTRCNSETIQDNCFPQDVCLALSRFFLTFYVFAEYFYNAAVARRSRRNESCSTAAVVAYMPLQHKPFSGQQPTQLPADPSTAPLKTENLTIPCSAQKESSYIYLRETT